MYRCFICSSVLAGSQRKYCGPECVKRGHLIKANIWAMDNRERKQATERAGLQTLRNRVEDIENAIEKLSLEVTYLLERASHAERE